MATVRIYVSVSITISTMAIVEVKQCYLILRMLLCI